MSTLLPKKPHAEIRARQVHLLYQQGGIIQGVGIFLAVVTVALFWNVTDHRALLLWLAAVVLILLTRILINIRFLKIAERKFDAEKWEKRYTVGVFVSGIAWGILALFYEPHWPMLYQAMLFIIFTGLIGASFNTNATVFLAFPAFYVPLIAFLMYAMLQQTEDGHLELALLFLVYVIAMHTSSVRFYNRLTESLKLQLENERLMAHLAHSNERLIRLAEIDPLTQVFNRRYMDDFLAAAWEKHLKGERPLSLLFIDIDFFKQYNDTYGHTAGDRCLAAVARTLKQNIRTERDIVARYGGEEFAVILPRTDCTVAQHIAERITEDIRRLRMPHTDSAAAGVVTVSIGVASLVPERPDAHTLLLEAADRALYDAKRSGRDRTVCAA